MHATTTRHKDCFFYFNRGIVHPPSVDEGTERTWFEPEQRPRKRVPKRSVHGKQSPQGASKMSWRQRLFFFLLLFFWVEELFSTHTWTCNERNHKCQTEGHPQPKLQATLTTWVEADTKVCKEATCQAKQAAHKAVVHQPTAKPVHSQ